VINTPQSLHHIDPMAIAVSIGIALYLFIVALIPNDMLFKTKYTRKHLKNLENSNIPEAENNNSLMMDTYQSSGVFAKAFYVLPFSDIFHPYIVKAGMSSKVNMLFIICLIVFESVLVGFSFFKVDLPFPVILLLAIFLAYFIGMMVVRSNIKKRTAKFIAQFPDALDIIVRSVTSGFPVNAAVNMVHESMTAPISEEFKQISDEVLYGSTLVDALDKLSERMHIADVRFFAVVLALQQEVGGNLAETLANLSQLIRKRRVMKMKIHALTSEGRATGWVLGSLPLFVAGVISFMSPDFLEPLYNTSSGHHVVIAAIVSIAIGVGIVRKMTNMEI